MGRDKTALGVIVAAYLAIAIQYAARTPAWQVPDEPAHYNYVRYIVEISGLPSLQFGDYDQDFNTQFTNPANTPYLPIDPLRYEFHQPPLYYLLAAPIYALTGGSLFALRLVSVALGGALIVVAFLVAREVKPGRPDLALGAAAFVAFTPQHVAMLAGVNNDSLAELLLALIVLQTFRVLRGASCGASPETESPGYEQRSRMNPAEDNNRGFIALGILLGLGLITKTTDYLAVPLVIVALLFRSNYHLRFRFHPSPVTPHFLLVFVPALVIGGAWWLRNLGVYGGFDLLGLARHNAVVAGQPLTSDWIARLGIGPFLLGALTTTFHSFWGQFGWMGVPMPDWIYLGLGVLSLVAFIGWFSTLITVPSSNHPTTQPPKFLSRLLFLLTLFTFAAYVWYNLTFVQHQGRYLFPALIPLGLMFSIGIDRWTRLPPRPIGIGLYAGVFAGLAVLDVYALYRFVIPSLSG